MRRSRIDRYGALGVAAVLILGVFIYQYEPRTVSDAEIAMDTALESANKQSSATNSADDAASDAQLFSDDTNTGAPGAGDLDTPVSKDVVPPAEDPNTDGTQERIAPGDAPDSGSPAVTPGNSGTSDNLLVSQIKRNITVPPAAPRFRMAAATGLLRKGRHRREQEIRTLRAIQKLRIF